MTFEHFLVAINIGKLKIIFECNYESTFRRDNYKYNVFEI